MRKEKPAPNPKVPRPPLMLRLWLGYLSEFEWSLSSVVEHYNDTVGVTGSNPVATTTLFNPPAGLPIDGDLRAKVGIACLLVSRQLRPVAV